MTGTDPTSDLAFSSPTPMLSTGSDISTPDLSEIAVARETVDTPELLPEAVVTAGDIVNSRPVRVERTVTYVNRTPRTVARLEEPRFDPVIITVPAPEMPAPREVKLQNEYAAVYIPHESPDYDVTARETRTEGKSFASKVMPAIKKPFGWLKSFGSKLK